MVACFSMTTLGMLDVLLPTGKRAKLPGLPLEMGGRKTRVRHQPPVMGNDTRAVLAEAGYTEAQINDLIAQQVAIAADGTTAPLGAIKELSK